MKNPTLGVCYYPEHWPEANWSDDAQAMVEAGIVWVRIGEFAWSRIEPQPEAFEWEWLDRAIEVLANAGLKIILGTPTATPPRWMLDRWPDMLACDEQGHPRKFGSRRHYCFSHWGYRQEAARITQLMAQRYGHLSHVSAWQVDNEYSCHDTVLSYSLAAQTGFRLWLKERYGDITTLNEAWGNIFWSMEYDRFDQIELPNQTVTEPNPSHVMDFRRYSSDQVVAFNREQTNILKQYSQSPLVHNYMGRITDFDHYEVGEDLDIASWDSYPLGFLEDRIKQPESVKQEYMRQGDPDFQAFHHDLYRAVGKGRWWVMEQQPGPVNWAPFNPAPLPGMVRLWTFEAMAHGAEMVSYFRWRQLPFAQEQMHSGLHRPDGVPTPALAEVKQVFKELNSIDIGSVVEAPVALVFDYESQWSWQVQPQGYREGEPLDYFDMVFHYYSALRKLGLNVDIISPQTTNLSAYKMVIAPGLVTLSKNLSHALQTYSGVVLCGPRSGSKTDNFHIPDDLPPCWPTLKEAGVTVSWVESLRDGVSIPVEGGGHFCHWIEQLELSTSPKHKSHIAINMRRKDGNAALISVDNVYYLAGWPDSELLQRCLLALCDAADIEYTLLPKGLRIRDTQHMQFLFNYSAQPIEYQQINIEPAGVYWHCKNNNN